MMIDVNLLCARFKRDRTARLSRDEAIQLIADLQRAKADLHGQSALVLEQAVRATRAERKLRRVADFRRQLMDGPSRVSQLKALTALDEALADPT